MTINDQLHNSKTHRTDGFDQNCPKCLVEHGVGGIIRHLERCAKQNEADSDKHGSAFFSVADSVAARAVAAEQRRLIGILRLYLRHVPTAAGAA